MKKKTAQAEGELTDKPDDKHPFRRKQQKAIVDESFKPKKKIPSRLKKIIKR